MSDERGRSARFTFRIGAALIFAASGISLLGAGSPTALLALHSGWAAWVLTIGEVLGRGWLAPRFAGAISMTGGLLFLPVILVVSGQATHALLLTALQCMPLILAAVAPADLPAVAVAAAGCPAWAMGLSAYTGEPTPRVVGAGAVGAVTSALALWGSAVYRRAEAARERAVEQRLQVAQHLADVERRAAHAERFALLGHLAAGVAHQVNNPLAFTGANLRFVAERALERGWTDPEIAAALAEAGEGLERVGRLVKRLQSFAHPAAGVTSCEVRDAIAGALRLAQAGFPPGTRVELIVDDALAQVAMAQERLEDVLLNLLENAAAALVERGETGERRVAVRAARRPDGGTSLEVEDSGPGIPADVFPHLFEPFFSTRPAGRSTGLGLSLCRALVEAAGGQLAADNQPGGGARFRLVLPPAAPAAPAPGSATAQGGP